MVDPWPDEELGADPITQPIPKVHSPPRRGRAKRVAALFVGIAVIGLLVFGAVRFLPPHWLRRLTHQGFTDVASGQQVTDDQLRWTCQASANPDSDPHCEAVALINSIQNLWEGEGGPEAKPVTVVFFRGTPQTACTQAGHPGLPFYCHTDRTAYINLDFYESLDNRMARGYVLAHIYAHNSQPGTLSGDGSTELQADCDAGAWASHATLLTTSTGEPLMGPIGKDDINAALAAAGRIDDHDNLPPLERKIVGDGPDRHLEVVPRQTFSHGTPGQRANALTAGLSAGILKKCRTTGY